MELFTVLQFLVSSVFLHLVTGKTFNFQKTDIGQKGGALAILCQKSVFFMISLPYHKILFLQKLSDIFNSEGGERILEIII